MCKEFFQSCILRKVGERENRNAPLISVPFIALQSIMYKSKHPVGDFLRWIVSREFSVDKMGTSGNLVREYGKSNLRHKIRITAEVYCVPGR